MESINSGMDYIYRGTQIFCSNSPDGPFVAFSNLPQTPLDQMALDGTLYVEDRKPYMIYCHEWIQLGDGVINVAELTKDLSSFKSTPRRLFYASSAPWVSSLGFGPDASGGYVTDGCFLYRSRSGKLMMIWSSFSDSKYSIGVSVSVSGSVFGLWKHNENILFDKDGGHGMLFRSFDGKLYLVFHSPNAPGGAERACILEIVDDGETLKMKE